MGGLSNSRCLLPTEGRFFGSSSTPTFLISTCFGFSQGSASLMQTVCVRDEVVFICFLLVDCQVFLIQSACCQRGVSLDRRRRPLFFGFSHGSASLMQTVCVRDEVVINGTHTIAFS